MELKLEIRYVKDQGWVAWLIHEGDPAFKWTPVEVFHDTPAEAAEEALAGLPDLLEEIGEVSGLRQRG